VNIIPGQNSRDLAGKYVNGPENLVATTKPLHKPQHPLS